MSAAIEVSQRDLAAAAPLAPATKTARHACIAGDDTVLVITRGAQVAADVARHLLALADPSARA